MADAKDDDNNTGYDPHALRNRLLTTTAAIRNGLADMEGRISTLRPPEWDGVDALEALFDAFIRDARMLNFRLTGYHLQSGLLKRED